MIDLSRVDPRLYDYIDWIVDELATTVGLDPDSVLVVGAGCRDILHAALGHTFSLRATTDTDLGIAVDDWTVSERIESRFRRIGSNGIRYVIHGRAVGIMPFGEIEDPAGIAQPAARGQGLVVFGFHDVYVRALRLRLPNGMEVRLPHPAGYAALKMRSWIDRSAYGDDRDAKDLALAAFWYAESPDIRDRLYDSDGGFEFLTAVDMDVNLAAITLLARDVAGQLTSANLEDLTRRWAVQDLDALARAFTLPSTGPMTAGLARRRQLVAQLTAALHRAP